MYVRRLAAQKYIASCVCLIQDCLLIVQFVHRNAVYIQIYIVLITVIL